MHRARLALVLALTAQAGACGEAPSFYVRWRVLEFAAGPDELPATIDPKSVAVLTSVAQCTELGIRSVVVTTQLCGEQCTSDSKIVDTRTYPCFPDGFEDPDAMAPGPAVGPGRYTVQLVGYGRRDSALCLVPDDGDTGGPLDLDEDGKTCEVKSAASQEFVITETGEEQRLAEVVLLGVPECRDGVDNDLDGATDLADPSCRGDRGGSEFGDVSGAQLTIRPTLFDGNPHATCGGLGLASIRLKVAGPTAFERTYPCTTTAQTYASDLDPGTYTITVDGLDKSGAVRATAGLAPESAGFELFPSDFRALEIEADFDIASFLGPIDAGFSVSWELQAVTGELPVTSCTPGPGPVTLDRVRLTVLDDANQPVPAMLLPSAFYGAATLDGVQTIPCNEFTQTRTVAPLVWDDATPAYSVRFEMLPVGSDTPCFGNPDAPEPTAPNASFPLTLPRLSDQGACN